MGVTTLAGGESPATLTAYERAYLRLMDGSPSTPDAIRQIEGELRYHATYEMGGYRGELLAAADYAAMVARSAEADRTTFIAAVVVAVAAFAGLGIMVGGVAAAYFR